MPSHAPRPHNKARNLAVPPYKWRDVSYICLPISTYSLGIRNRGWFLIPSKQLEEEVPKYPSSNFEKLGEAVTGEGF